MQCSSKPKTLITKIPAFVYSRVGCSYIPKLSVLQESYILILNFQRAQDIIKAHNASKPLFLYMAFQNVHGPDQAPQKYTDKYSFIEDRTRRTYAGMVDIMDEAVGNITEAMKDAGYDIYGTNK